jgi:hypothetical protein
VTAKRAEYEDESRDEIESVGIHVVVFLELVDGAELSLWIYDDTRAFSAPESEIVSIVVAWITIYGVKML